MTGERLDMFTSWPFKTTLMKYILLIAMFSFSMMSCKKEFSLEGQPLQENFLIENENGGLNFFIHNTQAEISVNIFHGSISVPVNESKKYFEYEVSAKDLEDHVEYIIELQYHSVPSTGTFDLLVEGFTAIQGTKSFWLKAIPISVTDAGAKKKILKMTRSGSRYTFSWY